MQFIKGMRDKLQKYLDESREFVMDVDVAGNAVYDCCCFGVDADGKLSNEQYMVFYNQTASPNGEIRYSAEGNKSSFRIHLSRLPKEIAKLVFTLSIDGDGTMADLDRCCISLRQDAKKSISLVTTKADYSQQRAIIFVEIYQKDGWRLAAVLNGFNGGLSALLAHFGGEEEKTEVHPASDRASNMNQNIPIVSENTVKNSDSVKETKKAISRSITSREIFNKKAGNGEPSKITFQYNPYTVESIIAIDGREVQPPNKLYDLRKERIQVWMDQLLPELLVLCNDTSFEINFYGLRPDYEDLYEMVREYCGAHSEMEVSLIFTETRSSEDRLAELQKLFQEMQRECPFEDLKTKQIQENFEKAMGTEFEVSVIATMSSGKSTLINALLGRELMPSKNEACTATIAAIKDVNNGNRFAAKYRDKENNVLGTYSNLTLADMEEMNENPQTAYIDIEGNIPNIDSSGIQLVLVDTPGPNNSRTEEHKNHTYRVIKERTKPMVLYVLNATQLQTNDDHNLLSVVADAMKVGGKQSKDRFLFAVNKIDQFYFSNDSVQVALQHVREYLLKFGIENPNIFPTSAETAKVIRMYQSGAPLTRGQNKTLENRTIFIEEPQLHLSEQASLNKNNQMKVKNAIAYAKQAGNEYEEILWHTGIPAVELAINEYLRKYAYTAKIKTAVDTFKKKVEEKDLRAKMLASIQNNEHERETIHKQLERVKRILDEGKEAQQFRERIEYLDMTKEAVTRIQKLRVKITRELNPSNVPETMTLFEVRQLMLRLKNTIEHLQSNVKTELEEIIADVVVGSANAILKEYETHIHEMIESGMVKEQGYRVSKDEMGLKFLEMDIPNAEEIIDNYKYTEEYDTGKTKKVKNTDKKWYKPWTWFDPSEYEVSIYDTREMVEYSTVQAEYLTPAIKNFTENCADAGKIAEKEAEKFKQFFLDQLDGLREEMRKKVHENEKLTQDQSSISAVIELEKERVQWLEDFLVKLDAILAI